MNPVREYHKPVLLKECLEGLNIRPDGVYVDVTFGGGGHSAAILDLLGPSGRLFAFDQDPDAQANAPRDERFNLIPLNFRLLGKGLRLYGIRRVDGLLADLGVSSHQLDEGSRGFSLRFDGPLDMRMNPAQELDASVIVNEWEEQDLIRIFRNYGELPQPHRAARALLAARPVKSTAELTAALEPLAPRKKQHQFLAQAFQALRIAVNDEMAALNEMLEQCTDIIRPGGRLVVITYHSLEDRPVKNFIREGVTEGEAERDFYGARFPPFRAVNRKPILPSETELLENTRSRSAKLRIAERTEHGTQGT